MSNNLLPVLRRFNKGRLNVALYVPRTGAVSPISEQHLLQRLRIGDPEAFRQIVSSYQSPLLRRARAMISDHALGEDAVQETWLAVLRGIHNFQSRSSLKTWIFSILDNRARTLVKKEHRTVSSTPEIMSAIEGVTVRNDPNPFRRALRTTRPLFTQIRDNQESTLISQEGFRHIRVAIGLLPMRQRKVFEWRVLRGYSARSISLKLGISEGNQRVLLHRARLALRTSLKS